MLGHVALWLTSLAVVTRGNLLQNGGMDSTDHWNCWNFQCTVTFDRHSGSGALQTDHRTHSYQGPGQYIQVTPGQSYSFSAWVRMMNEDEHTSQRIDATLDFLFPDGTHDYPNIASHSNAKMSDGWVHLTGSFTVPSKAPKTTLLYFQSGPTTWVNFAVDEVVVEQIAAGSHISDASLNAGIDQNRKSNVHVHFTTAAGINKNDVQIHVLQTKKSFPFGSAISAPRYNSNAAGGKYRDFIHQHFNWAVPENALKWPSIEPNRGDKNYQPALDMIHGLKSHGIKVRGHNLVWSVPEWVQNWIKQLSGTALSDVVKQHIDETMSKTRGLLEHWDVNNENLHGTFFQDQLHDPSYNLELFRIAHKADSTVKLFLNDYDVVASGSHTNDYLIQTQKFKAANVGLYGIGVQCHFGNEIMPDATTIKQRLDTLAQAGVPIWVTELDVMVSDENTRADYYEKALRALYSHPSVEGILMWGFWDQAHWRGDKAALVKGNDLQLTAAGRRVLDLYENQWMTDETHPLPHSGSQMTVRGFHGDYEVRVMYQGKELTNLKTTFSLGKTSHTVNVNVHM